MDLDCLFAYAKCKGNLLVQLTAHHQCKYFLLARCQRFEQGEIGGNGGGAVEVAPVGPKDDKKGGALPILFSLILPGSGEAYMGYTRGYFMMAADILAWTQVAKYNSQGDDRETHTYS